MGRADRRRVAAAQLMGITDRATQQSQVLDPGRLAQLRDEALVDIAAVLAGLGPHERQGVLDEAAARYVEPDETARWHPVALALLVEAGAVEDSARAIRGRHGSGRGLSGLGEQAGRLP